MKFLYISAFVFILGLLNLLEPVRFIVHKVFLPFQFGMREAAIDVKEGMSFFQKVEELRQENIYIIEENLDLKSRVVELKLLEEENKLLKEQLKIKTTTEKNLVMANLMGNALDPTQTTFVIDKGAKDGIRVGDNVLRGSYLVGVIREVSDFKSKADFISSPNVSIAVIDADTGTRTEGLANGQYGSSIIMERILPSEELNLNDSIVTSGKDGVFIPGLLIGKVTKVVEVPTETLKSAYLETFLDLSKIRKVFVLTD